MRIAENVLFAFKRLLVSTEWGYGQREVYVDKDTCTLSVARTPALHTKVADNVLELQWCDGEWHK